MSFDGALIREQGVTFAIIVVKSYVLNSSSDKANMQAAGSHVFGPVPIILMAQNSSGTPTYYGRTDIVKFLANIDPRRIPWKHYTVS